MGLRLKFTLTLLGLALVPLAISTTVIIVLDLGHLKLSTKEYRLATASEVVCEVGGYMDLAKRELEAMGAVLIEQDRAEQEREALAQKLLRQSRSLEWLAIYDPQGGRVTTYKTVETSRPLVGLSVPDRLSEDLLGAARTEDPAFLATVVTADKRAFLPMLMPMVLTLSGISELDKQNPKDTPDKDTQENKKSDKKTIIYGYLMSFVRLDHLNEVAALTSDRRMGRRPDRVFVLDDAQRVVAHGQPSEVGRSHRGQGIVQGVQGRHLPPGLELSNDYERNGEDLLGSLHSMPELGLGVVVEQSRDEAYRQVTTAWRTAVVVGLGFALIALFGGLLMGRRLAEPVLAVARAAERVAGGDFDVSLPAVAKDEVGVMARAFNTMATDLRGYRERLVEETRIRADLGRYLGAELVEQVVKREMDLELGGRRQEVTILFADVVAFTPMAEKYPPEFVVGILNELFTFLTEIVFKNGGVVDKFIGDCVMAVFGTPRTRPDDPQRAVRTAEEMHHWLEVGNAKWRKDLGQELKLGIGIHTGEAVVGNIGSKKRMEYTVIGDAVNVAARLESLARPGQVLLSAATRDRLEGEFTCISIGEHQLSGRGQAVEIFALEE